MKIEEQAFAGLWPGREITHDLCTKYSGKFRGYNANIRMSGRSITFGLSRQWRQVGKDIRIGLMQELLAKLFRERKVTENIELYRIFMKKVHLAVPKTESEPELEESFDRVNENFFAGMVEKPNLRWNNSSSKLGSYDYGSDTITISRNLANASEEELDYVMHHEILHKKHKFQSGKSGLRYHTSEFRKIEKSFPNSAEIEKKLRTLSFRAGKRKGNSQKKSIFSRMIESFLE